MSRLKRTLTLLLALTVLLTGLPLSARANEEVGQRTSETPEMIQANDREIFDFNTDWLFIQGDDAGAKEVDYDDSTAKAVSLPHARENYDLYHPDIERLQSIDWYRRHFTLGKEYAGNRVFVEFDGGGQVNRIFVNGKFVGEARGTFTHFKYDITDFIAFGDYDNVIAVQVDSRYHGDTMPPGKSKDFHFFGGLHGEAHLTVMDPLHVASAFYFNDDVVKGTKQATLNGWVEIQNDYDSDQTVRLVSSLEDASGQVVSSHEETASLLAGTQKEVKFRQELENPHLWSPDDPYLYTAVTTLYIGEHPVDSVRTRIGIRTLKATKPTDSEGYFLLNGERIEVIGGNRHMQVPYLGNALTRKLHYRDAELLKHDLGINFVRTSHYQTHPAFLEACDEIGLLVEEEPLGWNDTPGWDQFAASSDAMVKRDRNHPSIVLWSIIPNERPTADDPSLSATRERQQKTKALDPSRLTIQEEFRPSTIVADVYGWHDYTNPNAAWNVAVPQVPKSWFVTEWNTNLGKHFIIPNDSESRKRNQVEQDGLKLSILSNDKRIMGTLKWDLFGYMTPNHAGSRGKNVDLYRCSGVYGRWHDSLNMSWLGYLMAAQAPNPEDVGPILHINSEWKADSPKNLTVTSNLDQVELYYGQGSESPRLIQTLNAPNDLTGLKRGLFRFNLSKVDWTEDSYLLAKGYRQGEMEVAKEDKIFASTYPVEKEGAHLLIHDTLGQDLIANGSDVAYLLMELQDKNDQREYYGDENVSVEILDGPGRLIYDNDNPRMADGLCGIFLKSEQDKTGETTIKAKVDIGEMRDDSHDSISYSGGWSRVNRQDAFGGSIHSAGSGQTATIHFTGRQLAIYSESGPGYGGASLTVDGQPAGNLTCWNDNAYGNIANQRVWKSAVLDDGDHTVVLTTNGNVNIDAIKVYDGVADVEKTIRLTTIADSSKRVPSNPSLPKAEEAAESTLADLEAAIAKAKGIQRDQYQLKELLNLEDLLEYAESVASVEEVGSALIDKTILELEEALKALKPVTRHRIHHTDVVMEGQENGVAYLPDDGSVWKAGEKNTYANKNRKPGDKYSITFTGVRIELHSAIDAAHGQAEVWLDNEKVKTVDMYHEQDQADFLIYDSGLLEPGRHVVEVRVTGQPTGNPNNACVSFSYADYETKWDPTENARAELYELYQKAEKIQRDNYSKETLADLDAVMDVAWVALKTEDDVSKLKEVKESLQTAVDALSQPTEEETILITALDSDKTQTQGTLNKVYYTAQNESDWVLENAENPDLYNRYLKKFATGQDPRPYAEITFHGVGIDLEARHSKTSGYAKVQLLSKEGDLIQEWEDLSLYDAEIGAGQPGTRSFLNISDLEEKDYRVRILPMNKALVGDLTSINFARARITVSEGESSFLSTEALAEELEKLNAVDLSNKPKQQADQFRADVIHLVKKSDGILTGAYPEIRIADPLPAGCSSHQLDALKTRIQELLKDLKQEIILVSAQSPVDHYVEFGTPKDQIVLPARVRAMTNLDMETKVEVTWTSETYRADKAGTYVFTGSLTAPDGMTNPNGVRVTVNVIVKEDTSALRNKLEEAKRRDLSSKSEEAGQELQKVMEEASALLADPKATADQISKMVEKLTQAIAKWDAILESKSQNIHYWVALDDVWKEIGVRETALYRKSSGSRWTLKGEDLERVYEPYGFKVEMLKDAISKGYSLFGQNDRGASDRIWFGQGLVNACYIAADGTAYAGLDAEAKGYHVFYLPKNTQVSSADSSSLISANTHYSVSVQDPEGWVYSETTLPDPIYTLKGEAVSIGLANKEAIQWKAEGRDGHVLEGQVGENKTQFTILKITQPYVIRAEKLEEPITPEVDKTALKNRYDELQESDLENKTPESKMNFEIALQNAQSVLENEEATQDQVNIALKALNLAYEGLEEIEPIPPQVKNGFYDAPAPLEGKVYYEDDNQVFGWKEIEGRSYFFRAGTGTMVKGWQYIDGHWRFFRDSGTMVKSRWEWLDKKWKFFNSKGESMDQFWEEKGKVWLSQAGPTTDYCKGWKTINGLRYFFRKTSGTRVEGWQYIDGYWRFFRKGSGTQAFGWQFIDGHWYYLRENTGTRVMGRQYIDGRWYEFRGDGTLKGNR